MLGVDAVLGENGLLAGALPGYESQARGSCEMARAVRSAIAGGRSLLVEAGTGTGKTLAYLVPAILSGMKVVISTGTKNLQEQIFHKDIPLLRAELPTRFSATLMKGISNYLCLRRFGEHRARTAVDGDILRRLPLLGEPERASPSAPAGLDLEHPARMGARAPRSAIAPSSPSSPTTIRCGARSRPPSRRASAPAVRTTRIAS